MSVERVAEWPGVAGFGATPRGVWESQNAGDPPNGSTTMTVIVIFSRLDASENSGTAEAIISHSASVATFGGWRFYSKYISRRLRFSIADGAGGEQLVGSYVDRPGDVTVGVGSYNSGIDLGLYLAGRDETIAAPTGYTPNSNGDSLVFGASIPSGSSAVFGRGLLAVLATDSAAIDAAGRAAAYDIVKANLAQGRDLDTGLSAIVAPEYYWDPRDIDWINGTWTDRIGAVQMNQQRALERISIPGRVL